ncbi:MAG: AmmeMemoRadiSam system radical SAM enzyme [Candidatus Omnitrophica bacterium]|nr:AmmeMemoRadiSam system radical SAM enzyme [Candidatus Omnitrophota bacterium]
MGNKMIKVFVLFLAISVWAQPSGRKEAEFYRKAGEGLIQCFVCPKNCTLAPGQYGFCRARKNIDGTLYSMGYGLPCSVNIDPIEKKPFFHFLPGTKTFSLSSAGCNLRCKFCQNWQISQFTPEQTRNVSLFPAEVISAASKANCPSIAYTYAEPVTFYEYMRDIAKVARTKGLKNLVHTAAFINPEPLEQLSSLLDAVNVDLKGFNPEYYREMCGGELLVILNSLKILKKNGVWLEITNLVVPGYNDKPEEIKSLCNWVVKNLGVDTPVHFSRFYPGYQLTHLPPTSVETLEKVYATAKKSGLRYVYIGNGPGHPAENTLCPQCGRMVIRRSGYVILENNLKEGKCPGCGAIIAGVWKP